MVSPLWPLYRIANALNYPALSRVVTVWGCLVCTWCILMGQSRFSHRLFLLAATKQLWIVQYVRLSVCLSVCLSAVTPFWLCSHHRIIMKFVGVITNDQGNGHAKGQGQRSNAKVTEVTTPLTSFRTALQFKFTRDDEMMHKGWCCLGEVPFCFSRSSIKFHSHTAKKNRRIWPRMGVSRLK